MSRAFDRKLKSVKQQLLPRREPPPDFTGWNPADVVQWTLENTDLTLQDMVRADKAAWEKNGSDVPDVSGAEFATLVSAEVVRWRKVVTEGGVKIE